MFESIIFAAVYISIIIGSYFLFKKLILSETKDVELSSTTTVAVFLAAMSVPNIILNVVRLLLQAFIYIFS